MDPWDPEVPARRKGAINSKPPTAISSVGLWFETSHPHGAATYAHSEASLACHVRFGTTETENVRRCTTWLHCQPSPDDQRPHPRGGSASQEGGALEVGTQVCMLVVEEPLNWIH